MANIGRSHNNAVLMLTTNNNKQGDGDQVITVTVRSENQKKATAKIQKEMLSPTIKNIHWNVSDAGLQRHGSVSTQP